MESAGRLVGSVAMVHRREAEAQGGGEYGQLRWLLLDPCVRGRGFGRALLNRALAYARAQGFARIYLETTDGLPASLALYRSAGFEIIEDSPAELWGQQRRFIGWNSLPAPAEPAGSSAEGLQILRELWRRRTTSNHDLAAKDTHR